MRLDQEALRVGDAFLHQIFMTGHIGKLLEQAGKVELGKARQIGKFLYRNIFRTVIGDIVAHQHEFFYIFMLLVAGNAGESGVGIKIGPPQRNEEADHQGVDTGLGKGFGIVVFPDHFLQIELQAAVELRVFLPGDQRVGEERVEQGIHGVYIADQAVIKKQDQPLAVGRGNQLVNRTGGVIQMSPS